MNCPICTKEMTEIYDPELRKVIYICPECGIEVEQEPQP